MRLGQHPDPAFRFEDEGIGKMPRLPQAGPPIEQMEPGIELQDIDEPVPVAIIIGFNEDMQDRFMPEAEGVREKLQRGLLRQPVQGQARNAPARDQLLHRAANERRPPDIRKSYHLAPAYAGFIESEGSRR